MNKLCFVHSFMSIKQIDRISFIGNRMIFSKCNAAVCQFTATNNKIRNLEIVKKLVDEAAQKEAKVAFLPECCDYIGQTKEETVALSEKIDGPLVNEYKILAKHHNIWISVGGFHELSTNGKVFNAHILIDQNGEIRSVYRKIHLFDVSIPEEQINLKESEIIKAGKHIVPPVDTPIGKLALSICYDLRFPEISTICRKFNAQILTYPSAFTNATGKMHWETLLKARAIENQCYVIAAAQYGHHNEKRVSYGQSLIIDPLGSVIAQCPKFDESTQVNESIAVAAIDLEMLSRVRMEMPVFEHRRNDCYQLQTVKCDKIELNDNELFAFSTNTILGSTIFYKTSLSYAFTNIRCVVPGHVLISSIRVVPRLKDLSEEEVADLFQTAVKVQQVMEKVHSSVSTTMCVQDGKYAGQTIPHVHVHILPRQPNDFDRNDDIYDVLSKHDREDNPGPLRTIEEMTQEAKMLRPHFN